MATDSQSPALVLTTSSPGLAWVCVHAAGVDPYGAAVLTTPGAGIASLDGELGQNLSILTQLMGVVQITVVGHREDPVYSAPRPPEPGRPPGQGAPAGLADNAVQTVRSSVRQLVGSRVVPKGTVVAGVVVEGDGSSDNVALEIAEGGKRPTRGGSATIRVQGHEVGWDDLRVDLDRELASSTLPSLDVSLMESLGSTAAAVPAEEILGSAEISSGLLGDSGEVSLGPASLGGKITADRRGTLGALTSGQSAVGGETGPLVSSGAIGSGHSTSSSGPQNLLRDEDDPLSRRESNEIQRSTGAAQLGSGEIPSAAPAHHGATPTREVPEPTRSTPAPAPAPAEPVQSKKSEDIDLLNQWFESKATVRKKPQPLKPNTLQDRLEDAAVTLGDFIENRCKGHGQCKETTRLLQAGASPGAVMRSLLTMVREFGHDRPDVHAAFSTLEMAQSLLSKEEMRLVLRRILL